MQTDFILKSFIYTSILLNIYIIKSIPVNEPNVFYVNDDTNEGQRIGRITHFNGNQQANFKIGNTKAVIVRGNRPPAIYFRLNENTGDLYTRTIIDHEALCSKQSQIVGNLNNIPTNNDFTETNYQYRSLLSSTSNSKIIQQCKFTFQVALHRTLLSDQSQKTDHFIEPGYPNLPEFIDIHIIIIDRNDHSPIFQPHSMINISIPELVPIGTRIQLPLAYDPDSPEYSIQRYELYPITINDFALYIQTTDIIYNTNIIQEITGLYLEVKTLLDRELRDSYILKVKAFDSSITNPMNSPINDNRNVLKIYLTIEDINDNGPIFQPQTNFTPIESSIDNTAISNIFTSTANIIINVIDINDEIPMIELDYLRIDETTGRPATFARIEENIAPPQFIADILVTDRDVNTVNSYVICTLLDKPNRIHDSNSNNTMNTLFQLTEIKRQSGLVQYNLLTINSLDREVNGSIIRPRIQCTDSGLIKKSSEVEIIIHIIDVNDNIPFIQLIPTTTTTTTTTNTTNNSNFINLKENTPTGTIIGYFNITDYDIGDNSRTKCQLLSINNTLSLININEYFFIDPITCNLIINKPIDRELFYPPINQIQLFIEINDYGLRKDIIDCIIEILDNDKKKKKNLSLPFITSSLL
ncbi:putative cadherin [Schistosoma mansoni]|uniref:putative cadherin n=1 Tax=Schistosoma mansoni TaxID=6183 RepID=UPI0001A62F88|nr:putative cadherin [Schistosoma mansoni]|eukprot:XP_018652409.1 putative cadherin [Schistosoma mansoni]